MNKRSVTASQVVKGDHLYDVHGGWSEVTSVRKGSEVTITHGLGMVERFAYSDPLWIKDELHPITRTVVVRGLHS